MGEYDKLIMSSNLPPIFGNNQGFPEVFESRREIGAHSRGSTKMKMRPLER